MTTKERIEAMIQKHDKEMAKLMAEIDSGYKKDIARIKQETAARNAAVPNHVNSLMVNIFGQKAVDQMNKLK